MCQTGKILMVHFINLRCVDIHSFLFFGDFMEFFSFILCIRIDEVLQNLH